MRTYLKSQIFNVAVTKCDANCHGSITIGKDLMEKYNIDQHEQVHVLGVDEGETTIYFSPTHNIYLKIPPPRCITYVIEGKGSEICCNGGLANIFKVGDIVNIVSYEVR